MTPSTIFFLRNSKSGLKRYSLSFRMMCCIVSFLTLGISIGMGTLYWQHQDLLLQAQIIEDQEVARSQLQRQLDSEGSSNARMVFLETYVKELKQESVDSRTTLKKHQVLQNSSITKLAEIYDTICRTLSLSCTPTSEAPPSSQESIAWMEQVYQNFQSLDGSVQSMIRKQHTFEEQNLTIQQLRSRLLQAEQDLVEHVQFIDSQNQRVAQLSKKITQATGIPLQVSQKTRSPRLKTLGRGGASLQDRLSLETPQSAINSEETRRFLYGQSAEYSANIQTLESLSLSVEKNQNFWKHTPTLKPVQGRGISDSYGIRKDPFTGKRDFHSGMDFSAKTGTPIIAPADGVVKYSKRHKGYGLFIELVHGRGFYPNRKSSVQYSTRYAHMSKLLVRKGQWVKRGEKIGLVGSTGRSTGPHLHYEVLINNRHSNPMRLLSRYSSQSQRLLYH